MDMFLPFALVLLVAIVPMYFLQKRTQMLRQKQHALAWQRYRQERERDGLDGVVGRQEYDMHAPLSTNNNKV